MISFRSPRQVSYHALLGTTQIKQKRHSLDINTHMWVDRTVIKFHRICTFRYSNCLLSIQISSWSTWPEANKKNQNTLVNSTKAEPRPCSDPNATFHFKIQFQNVLQSHSGQKIKAVEFSKPQNTPKLSHEEVLK